MGRGALPGFGHPIGLIVNYTPDRAIRYDLDGKVLATLPRARRLAEAYIAVRNLPLPVETLRAVMPIE